MRQRQEERGDGALVRHGDDYEWFVQELTDEMVHALAGLTDGDVGKHGAAMAKTAELKWPEKEGRAVVEKLRELAKKARGAKKRMYLWTSV